MHPTVLRAGFNLWPPFLFSGIHVTQLSPDWRHAQVELRARPWNRNYVGTHFGGSLFAMTDPFWMILVMRSLGPNYFVWDKAAEVEFVKPGRGTVRARFDLEDATLDALRAATADGAKHLHWLPVQVTDGSGDVVARVRKQIYVRRKPSARGLNIPASSLPSSSGSPGDSS
jgi:acyl-coenzyme A thioesterase PaaI-like protein